MTKLKMTDAQLATLRRLGAAQNLDNPRPVTLTGQKRKSAPALASLGLATWNGAEGCLTPEGAAELRSRRSVRERAPNA